MKHLTPIYDKAVNQIDIINFKLPLNQALTDYFPEFLSSSLEKFEKYYKEVLEPKIGTLDPEIVTSIAKAAKLSSAINETVSLYYKGKIHEAYSVFSKGLDDVSYNETATQFNIFPKTSLYRGKLDENKNFSKQDLFHVPFENRNFVSTNRYSVPGLPALYLSGSIYTCWQELNRHNMWQLWFSRFQVNVQVRVAQIRRIEDFYKLLIDESPFEDIEMMQFLNEFLTTFPLSIACSIKVRDVGGRFKPEYIIPQLLLQYVSKSPDFDGILYLSTIIDYSKIHNVNAYNYVFPVKNISKSGFCNVLCDKFSLTSPTSLEIEELRYNVKNPQAYVYGGELQSEFIEMIEGIKNSYSETAFGRLEQALKSMETGSVI